MTTVEIVPKKNKPEPSAEETAAKELVRAAREQGLSLTGPDGLLKQFTKSVLEAALNEEMTEHLGHEKHRAPEERESTKIRNGTRPKTVLTDATGHVEIDVPRDRDGSFEPQIVKKRQRRLTGVDEIYGASVSKETISPHPLGACPRTSWCPSAFTPVATSGPVDAALSDVLIHQLSVALHDLHHHGEVPVLLTDADRGANRFSSSGATSHSRSDGMPTSPSRSAVTTETRPRWAMPEFQCTASASIKAASAAADRDRHASAVVQSAHDDPRCRIGTAVMLVPEFTGPVARAPRHHSQCEPRSLASSGPGGDGVPQPFGRGTGTCSKSFG